MFESYLESIVSSIGQYSLRPLKYLLKQRKCWADTFDHHLVCENYFRSAKLKRSILQTLWKTDCCAKILFIELEASNFGYLLIFDLVGCAKCEQD